MWATRHYISCLAVAVERLSCWYRTLNIQVVRAEICLLSSTACRRGAATTTNVEALSCPSKINNRHSAFEASCGWHLTISSVVYQQQLFQPFLLVVAVTNFLSAPSPCSCWAKATSFEKSACRRAISLSRLKVMSTYICKLAYT